MASADDIVWLQPQGGGEPFPAPRSDVKPGLEQYLVPNPYAPAPPAMSTGAPAYVPPPMQQPSFLDRARDVGGNVLETLRGMKGTAERIGDATVGRLNRAIEEPLGKVADAAVYRAKEGLHNWMPSDIAKPELPASLQPKPRGDGQQVAAPSPSDFVQPPGTGGSGGQLPDMDGALSLGVGGGVRTGGSVSMRGPGGVGGRQKNESFARIDAATKAQSDAATAQADAQVEYARGLAAQRNAYLQERDAFEEERQIKEARRQEAVDGQMGRMREAIDAVRGAKVDPRRLYANMGTGEKVLAGVALALGGLGAASTGQNLAVGVIQKAVDDDVQAQLADIQNMKEAASAERGLFADMLRQLGDERQAEAATKAALTERALFQIETYEKTAQDPIIKANLQAVRAGLQEKNAENYQQAWRAADESARGWANFSLNARRLDIEQQKAQAKAAGIDPELMIPGVGIATGKEQAKEIQERAEARDMVKRNLQRVAQLREKYGAEATEKTEGGRLLTSAQSDLITNLGKLKKLGAFDTGSKEILEAITGGDAKSVFFSPSVLAQIENEADQGFESAIKYRLRYRLPSGPQSRGEALR